MSGSRAKQIRKAVYGDASLREERKYKWGSTSKKKHKWGTVVATGLRRKYQDAKKLFYQLRRA